MDRILQVMTRISLLMARILQVMGQLFRNTFPSLPEKDFRKQKTCPKQNCWDRLKILYLRCHPAWCTPVHPLSAHYHMPNFFYGDSAPSPILPIPGNIRKIRFRSPSEAHSAKSLLPRFHHPQLSGKRDIFAYSLFFNGFS